MSIESSEPTRTGSGTTRSRHGRKGLVVSAMATMALLAAACGSSASTPHKAATSTSAAPAASSGSSSPATSGTSVTFFTSSSAKSFADTVSSLKTAVSSAGMMVLGNLNQAGALSVTGLSLKGAETFFVGNPTTGKKLFQMDPAVGALLPVRMYVWVDSAGGTDVGYLDPASLAAAVNPQLSTPAQMISQAASKIVRSVTGTKPSATASVSASFVSVQSSKSFADTVSSLKTAVSSAGMMVLGNLNQAGALSVTGLSLKGAETFFVGNPTTGKKLFQMDPAVGMEIPVGFYVWVNSSGVTEIGYFQPSPILTGINKAFSSSGSMFDGLASKIAHAAA